MKRIAILSALALCLAALAPAASAQMEDNKNHGNFGVFFNFTRPENTSTNFYGVGARLGFNVQRHVVMEGEMAYDFEQNISTNPLGGIGGTTGRTRVRMLHGLFGPKIQTTGPVRVFAVLKGGFVNFGVSGPVTAGTINNQFNNIVNGDTNGTFYPGGGVEFNLGWLGIRLEAGDEMQFLSGGHTNNLRMTAGPQIRF